MKNALIALAICGAAQPAFAQWGLFGFAADGEVLRIDHATGTAWNVGHIGKPVVAATSTRDTDQDFFVLTADDQLLRHDRKTGLTALLLDVVGRPVGYEPVAMEFSPRCTASPEYVAVVLSPPIGDDVLYRISLITGDYELMWPTGQDGIVALDNNVAMDASGRRYTVDCRNQQFRLQTTPTPPSPTNSYVAGPCRSVYSVSNELWTAPWEGGSWQLVGGSGLGDVIDVVYADAEVYADCDTYPSGVGRLDLFDFLCFQNEFVTGSSYACDCDTSTGSGVCDLFDFLCFQNAFVIGFGNGC